MPIEINGREFKAVTNSTMRHDVWVQGQLERSGITHASMESHESPQEFAMRLFRQAAMNMDIFLLIGGLLMPASEDPVKWTPKMAQETADFLGAVTRDEDKAAVQAQIHAALTSFFITGLVSLTTSQRSSQRPGNESVQEKTGDV